MKLNKRWKSVLATSLVLIGAAGFAYHTFGQSDTLKAKPFKPQLNPNGTELVVRGFKIGQRSSSQSRTTLTGSLQPRFQSPVGFRVAGKIASRHVEVGSRVKKGDLLFSLDPVDYDLQLKMAESDVISAEAQLKQTTNEEARLRKLRSSSAISQSEYELILSTRDVANARLESAQKRLDVSRNQRDYCDLKADRDGLIVGISGESGQVVAVGQPVLILMQGSELEVLVSVPENQVSLLQSSQATASIWSDSQRSMKAELRELSPMADAVTRTFDARFKLLDASNNLSPGMTASIELASGASDQLSVPMSALAKQLDSTIVWKIDPAAGTVTAVPVEVERYQTNMAIVRGSLNNGDWIVSAGVQRIDADVKVRLWNSSQQ